MISGSHHQMQPQHRPDTNHGPRRQRPYGADQAAEERGNDGCTWSAATVAASRPTTRAVMMPARRALRAYERCTLV